MRNITIYCDGSSFYNGQPHQWGAGAAVLEHNFRYQIRGEYENGASNNRAEMIAACVALESLPEPCNVTIVTDSQLVINCASGKWNRKANLDLWERYDKASKPHTVNWQWVKGHTGDEMNELAHEHAYKFAYNRAVELEYVGNFNL
jgi:ribonuclease HI